MIWLKFEFVKLAKTSGRMLMILAVLIGVNVIVIELMGGVPMGVIGFSLDYFVYGIVLYGMGMIVDYQERHYQEMKFFRNHYIEKDKQNDTGI